MRCNKDCNFLKILVFERAHPAVDSLRYRTRVSDSARGNRFANVAFAYGVLSHVSSRGPRLQLMSIHTCCLKSFLNTLKGQHSSKIPCVILSDLTI
jgi:hypothetical protein